MADLTAFYLLLGPACNMTCRHCTQTPIKNTFNCIPESGELSQEVFDFIAKWAALPCRRQPYRHFFFWGGEPLLYWNTIKALIARFHDAGIKNLEYCLFTNGLLLTDEIVDYINEHDISLAMSHDAPNPTAVRNAFPSDEKCKLFLKVKKRRVHTVMSGGNDSMVEAYDYLEKKFPDTFISCAKIHVLSEIPKDIYTFPAGKVDEAVSDLAKRVEEGDEIAADWFVEKTWRFLIFNKREFLQAPWPPCRPGLVSLSCDFKGNIMRCHNDNVAVAHIFEPFKDIAAKHLALWQSLLPENCVTCPALAACRCICPLALRSDDGKELRHCKYLREFWAAVKREGDRLFKEGVI